MIPRFEPTATYGEILAFLRDVAIPLAPDRTISEFERWFADYHEVDSAVFVPSGRIGLWLILRALDFPPGAEIIVPAFTFFAIPAVIQAAGLKPVFADIDPATYELTPDAVRAVLSPRTRALIPTHLFGRTCPMPELERLSRSCNLDLIEDCAQSCGATVGHRKTGSLGRAAYFTFGITKNFTTFSGGMVVCRERRLDERVRGAAEEFRAAAPGRLLKEGLTALALRAATQRSLFNLTLAPLLACLPAREADVVHRLFEERSQALDAAALQALQWRPGAAQARAGLRQLRSLDAKNAARRRQGAELLRRLQAAQCAGLPAPAEQGGDHIYISFAIRRPERFAFARRLQRLGVDISPGYMRDCSALPELGGRAGLCPQASGVDRSILHLPLYPGLRPRDVERIAGAVAACDAAARSAARRPPDGGGDARQDPQMQRREQAAE
jgi:dTDP-4-amino-4,6-dideoxygalactose transaminase